MTRTYALKRLLEHGPLTIGEMVSITRWEYGQVKSTVGALCDQGIAVLRRHVPGDRRRLYLLAD